ncbi:MAG: hypothetical protein ABIJ16_14160 [Bacteroidota bacterium]
MSVKLGLLFFLSVVFFAFTQSCKSDADSSANGETNENIDEDVLSYKEHGKKVKMIFYNVPSPIEMAKLLEESEMDYNPEILNSYDNYDKYTTNSKTALNLGVYGADLSYTRLFDQIQNSVNYLASIKKLSDGLGIPQEEGSFTVSRIEENMENRDSILLIISQTYSTADAYLKENDRGSTAALIILGGWIEALYIATHIIDEKNPDRKVLERIAEQKFSLSNLIELINSYEDEDLDPFVPQLKELQAKFEKIEITYTKGEVITDEVNMTTTIQSQSHIEVSIDNIKEIGTIVEGIRMEIIE